MFKPFLESGKKRGQEESNFNEYKMPVKCCSEFITKWTVPTLTAAFDIFGSIKRPSIGPAGNRFSAAEHAEVAEGRAGEAMWEGLAAVGKDVATWHFCC